LQEHKDKMAKAETKNNPKDMIEATPEEMDKVEVLIEEEMKDVKADVKAEVKVDYREQVRLDKAERAEESKRHAIASWVPKTEIGKMVKSGKEKNIDNILDSGKKILEAEIVDSLLKLDSDLLLVGQAKGKFGGGKRRAWRQTQKKTMEGNVITFSSMVVVGDRKGHVGLGYGKSKETLPAREKAMREAKLNIVRINRGFETPEPGSKDPHTVPFKIEGKCGSVRMKLLPAPRGTGLVIGDECKKILRLAGIKDVYSRTTGQTRTTFNFAQACMDALSKTRKMEEVK